MNNKGSVNHPAALIVVIEEDPLTRWSLESYLTPRFRVVSCTRLDQAVPYFSDPDLQVIIWGNPNTTDSTVPAGFPPQGDRVKIIALVSDSNLKIPSNMTVMEKPFVLEQLAKLLHIQDTPTG